MVNRPVADLFAFHERPDALELLTPAFPPVRVIRKSGGLEVGARVELRVLIFKWVALHTAYERDRLFVDEQIQGPFAKWVHRHEFEDLGHQSRLTDRLEFALPGGKLTNVLFAWMVKPGLAQMFRHRHRVTAAYLA